MESRQKMKCPWNNAFCDRRLRGFVETKVLHSKNWHGAIPVKSSRCSCTGSLTGSQTVRYSYSFLAGDTHTQARTALKSIEYLLILILTARIGNHTHEYLSIQVLSCHPNARTAPQRTSSSRQSLPLTTRKGPAGGERGRTARGTWRRAHTCARVPAQV